MSRRDRSRDDRNGAPPRDLEVPLHRGAVYRDLDEAARRIEETVRWTDADWRGAAHRAIDRAWMGYTDDLALRPIYDAWLELVGARASS